MKRCAKCKVEYDTSNFYKASCRNDGLYVYCKQCCKKMNLERSRRINVLPMQIFHAQRRTSKIRGFAPPSYTKHQLLEWMLSNHDYKRIFEQWVEAGYPHELKPSCDRIDDYKSYTLDNLQILTWDENRKKSWSDKILGINNKQSKAVIQMTRDGEFVNKHYSIQQAYRDTGIDYRSISSVCVGRRKTAGNFKWKFEEL